ncbi:MAG: hypothetical protein KF862_28195 [Chitinophagaceae bacterium]|nr:hypothetical protein [Chitinophagaceae bacterium]
MNVWHFVKKSVLLLLPAITNIVAQNAGAQTSIAAPPALDSAFISFRIGLGQSLSAGRFNELLRYFEKHKRATSEITFFTSITHPPPPLKVLEERVAILKDRMSLARQRGFKTGINLLNTVGHLNENLDNSLQVDYYTHMTDIEGKTYEGSYCPNDERYRKEYIIPIYRATALASPDYIWIDDDVRLRGYGNIQFACFCDHCLEIFAGENGTKYTRAQLKKTFDEGAVDKKLEVRKAWIQHNRNTMASLFTLIEKEVRRVNPKIALGFMSSDLYYAGYDFSNWAKILAGANNIPVMWRPGGGAYDDLTPSAFIAKAHSMGRQASALPPEVRSIQSEIENFPYPRFKKSATMVAFEAAAYIAAGCTGAAYNVLTFHDEPLDEYEPLAEKLQQVRPFLDLMAKHFGRTPVSGLFSYWNKNSEIAVNPQGNWLTGKTPLAPMDLYENGLPVSYQPTNASVTMITKDMIYAMDKTEIMQLLQSAVYMDAEALQQFNELGYGELTGFEVVRSENKDRIERLTNHPLNGAFSGRLRDNRQSFWMQPAYTFKKSDPKAEILSELTDYTDKTVGECAMGIFQNRLGGRICVAGYYPWQSMGNLSKNTQIKAVFRWLSNNQLPAYIGSFHKMNIWARKQGDKATVAISNSSFDEAKNVQLMLHTTKKTIRVYDMHCKETVVRASGADGPYQKFIIPSIDPWRISLVVTE